MNKQLTAFHFIGIDDMPHRHWGIKIGKCIVHLTPRKLGLDTMTISITDLKSGLTLCRYTDCPNRSIRAVAYKNALDLAEALSTLPIERIEPYAGQPVKSMPKDIQKISRQVEDTFKMFAQRTRK